MTGLPPLLVIGGATATGKTGLAIRVAEALRADGLAAEIISADSRQVFRGLDIGTAKATREERARVPHHGLDLVDPDEPFSVADFADHARAVLATLATRQGLAILAGGTGFYLRTVARGLDTDALPHDADTRARIEAELAAGGLAAATARLASIAPVRSSRTDLRNPRRVARALELAELTGDAPLPAPRGYPGPVAWIGLSVDPGTHNRWIAERARGQFASGLIDEARRLRDQYDAALPAFSAIGYREAWDVLDGRATLEQAIEIDVRRNITFAKRQRTWFRAEPEIRWLDPVSDGVDDAAIGTARELVERGAAALKD